MCKFSVMCTAFLVLAAGLCFPSLAAEKNKSIIIENAWARASIVKSRPAAAYLTLVNRGRKSDRLVSASSPMAEKVSMHETTTRDGVMQMSPAHHIDLPPGKRVVLKPGGLHLMLMKLRGRLRKGGSLPLNLSFERAGRVTIQVPILGPGDIGPK